MTMVAHEERTTNWDDDSDTPIVDSVLYSPEVDAWELARDFERMLCRAEEIMLSMGEADLLETELIWLSDLQKLRWGK